MLWLCNLVGWIYDLFGTLWVTSNNSKQHFVFASTFGRFISKISTTFDYDLIWYPSLSPQEHNDKTRLGIDSWADTACAGKHAFVEEFTMGKIVTASGFSPDLGSLGNLPVTNILYDHDTDQGETIILE